MNEQNQFVSSKCSGREWELNNNLVFCVPTYILKPWFSKALRSRNSIMQGEMRHWDIVVRALAVPTRNVDLVQKSEVNKDKKFFREGCKQFPSFFPLTQ